LGASDVGLSPDSGAKADFAGGPRRAMTGKAAISALISRLAFFMACAIDALSGISVAFLFSYLLSISKLNLLQTPFSKMTLGRRC
jgi:hypothetical protein